MVKKVKLGIEDFTNLSQKHLSLLLENGITSIAALSDLTPIQLKTMLDTTLNKAISILKEARENLPPFKIISGKAILESDKSRTYLTTGCSSLDQLLGGYGLESGSITEVFAQFGTGKSQLAFSSIASALRKSKKSEAGSVIIIDTEGTFSSKRLIQILEYYGPDLDQTPTQLLEHVKVIRPDNSAQQKAIMKLFLENQGMGYLKYMELKKPLKLLVIDSLSGLFRAEFIGRGTLAQRQQKLNQYLRDLYLFGNKNQIPVLVTNQVISSPDPFHPGQIPVGGHVVAHACTYRIHLSKRKNYRIAKMVDSSRLPASQVMFKLGRRGVMPVDEEDMTPEEYIKSQEELSNKE